MTSLFKRCGVIVCPSLSESQVVALDSVNSLHFITHKTFAALGTGKRALKFNISESNMRKIALSAHICSDKLKLVHSL